MAFVPARIKGPGLVARTSISAVAEVGRRRLASNKLGKRAPKRVAGRVNGGLALRYRSVGDTAGRNEERKVRRDSASPRRTGEDRKKTQGGTRVPVSGRHIAESGAAVAGPGP